MLLNKPLLARHIQPRLLTVCAFTNVVVVVLLLHLLLLLIIITVINPCKNLKIWVTCLVHKEYTCTCMFRRCCY